METSKPKHKRIRHCYTIREIFHRFIHSEEYAYTPVRNDLKFSCKGNFLFIGHLSNIEIENSLFPYNINKIIAIIDRKKKRIVISKYYKNINYWNLERAIPNNYEIYFTRDIINNIDIIKNKNDLLEIHSKYLIEDLCNNFLSNFYYILNNNKIRAIHNDITNITNNYRYYNIINFIKKNKLNKTNFYDKCFNIKHKLIIWENYNYKTITIKLPTLKQIENNTIFNEEQKLILEQKYFYIKYCYGYGIPFKDVILYWHNTDWDKSLANKYNRNNVCVELLNTPNIDWNDYIRESSIAIEEHYRKYINENIKKSDENKNRALEQFKNILNNKDNIINWRENKGYSKNTFCISYKKFILPTKKYSLGEWKTDNLYSPRFRFDNIQLKLIDNIVIETSNHVRVNIKDGVNCWKLFNKIINSYNKTPNNDVLIRLEDKNIKVDIYNLRSIKYCDKVTDYNKPLNYKDWCIIIGCHHIWLEEILDFIKYYNLENIFGIEKETIKLKIKE